jgi:DNA-directed RNA polymerase subunit H
MSSKVGFVVAKRTKKDDTIEETKVTDHVLVPKHEILSDEEKKSILVEYNATEDQFPFLFSIDPVVREIGAKPGDMVKITRVSDTAGETTYYRYVVEAV